MAVWVHTTMEITVRARHLAAPLWNVEYILRLPITRPKIREQMLTTRWENKWEMQPAWRCCASSEVEKIDTMLNSVTPALYREMSLHSQCRKPNVMLRPLQASLASHFWEVRAFGSQSLGGWYNRRQRDIHGNRVGITDNINYGEVVWVEFNTYKPS